MTKAQIDLAHKTIGDIGHCVRAMEQYGNGRIVSVLRIAADLLQKMVDEYEASDDVDKTVEAMKAKHAPSDVYRTGLTGDTDG
jgi:hypothetical protein